MKRTAWILALSLVLFNQPAWAARTKIHEAAESPSYGRKFGGMIGRGVLNVTTSFVDIIVNLVNETRSGPPLVGTLTGVAKGTGCGILRLGSGAVDLVTFWVPGFNGFPVSDSYENCFAAGPSVVKEEEPVHGYNQPSSNVWDVPTTEPGAAQAPEHEHTPTTKKRTWSK